MKIKNLFHLFIAALVTISVSCASKKPLNSSEQAVNDSQDFFGEGVTSQADKPQAITPDWKKSSLSGGSANFLTTDQLLASSVVVYTLVGMVAGTIQVRKADKSIKDLNGTCAYGEANSPMQAACANVTVNLLDDKKEVVAFSSTNRQGQFRFYIPVDKSYYVQVADNKGRTSLTQVKLGRADFVSLFLKP